MLTPAPHPDPTRKPAGELAQGAIAARGRVVDPAGAGLSVESSLLERLLQLVLERGGAAT